MVYNYQLRIITSCLLLSTHLSAFYPLLLFFQGVLGAFNGLGYTTGPLIGSGLYELGGFLLPFLVLGALMLSTGVLSCFLLKETNGSFFNCLYYYLVL